MSERDVTTRPARLRKWVQACRQVFGIPDYDRYVEHMRRHHPGESTLSRRDYFAQAIDRKYARKGPRCC